MKSSKGNILLPLILIIAAVTIVVVGYFYFQNKNPSSTLKSRINTTTKSAKSLPSKNEAIEWKTHTSLQGYQLQYPSDMTVNDGMVTQIFNTKENARNSIIISIFRNSDVNLKSIAQWKIYYQTQPRDFKIVDGVTTPGVAGFEYDSLTFSQREALFTNETSNIPKLIYHVFVTYDPQNKNQAIKVFDNILSTFKFTTSDSSIIVFAKKLVKSGNPDVYVSLVSDIPSGAKVNDDIVTVGSSDFRIDRQQTVFGLCGGDGQSDNNISCSYTDERLKSAQLLRVWTENNNVFALNPQTIQIDGYQVNNLKIYKQTPTKYFTRAEVDFWRQLLGNLRIQY